MKKLLSILLITMFLFGCESKKQAEETVTVISPMKEVNSLKELNDTLGLGMTFLAGKESTNPTYYIIGEDIGEFNFDLSGFTYTLRGSKNLENDISGLYINGENAFKELSLNVDFVNEDGYKASRFILGSAQYVLMIKDNEQLSTDDFLKISGELIKTMGENAESNYPYSK